MARETCNFLTQAQWEEKLREARKTMELVPLDEKSGSAVYLLEKVVVKFAPEKEGYMGKFLFERGVSVPEVYAMIRDKWSNCIVMQKIEDALNLMNREREKLKIPGVEHSNLVAMLREEITKVLELGILPKDSDWFGNSLFSKENGRLYLIDFGYYREGSKEELKAFERKIATDEFIRTKPEN
ncbi:MAG: hypothetical protein WC238_05680 [Parcubacteria group bacterium]|jgi:RIO-like serine/threonine protein kinase